MADLIITERSNIVAVANAVRSQTGIADKITLGEIASSVAGMSGFIPVPDIAEVGQTIVVKAVDEFGKPIEWEAVNDIPYVASDTEPNNTNVIWVDTTDNTKDFEQVVVDYTLSRSGCAADAKKTGDAINLKADLNYVLDLEQNQIAQLQSELSSLNKIYVGDVEPENITDGMIWIDTSEQQDNNEV